MTSPLRKIVIVFDGHVVEVIGGAIASVTALDDRPRPQISDLLFRICLRTSQKRKHADPRA